MITKKELIETIKKEGDRFEFEYLDLKCLMMRMSHAGHWCGYVNIPKNTKLSRAKTYYYTESELGLSEFEQEVNDLSNSVHGGITFSGDRNDDGEMWWGFDCGHSYDIDLIYFMYPFGNAEYRDKDYVIAECKKLAERVKKLIDLYK